MSFNSRSISDELETSNDRFKSRPRYCRAESVESISVTNASAFCVQRKRTFFVHHSIDRKDVRQVNVQSCVSDDWYPIGDAPYWNGNDCSSDECLPIPFDVVAHEDLHDNEESESEREEKNVLPRSSIV